MPIVPTQRQSQFHVVPQEPPEPKYLAMAAAMMHSQGKLFKPPATFDERFPSPAIGGLNASKGPSMDKAFSNPDDEYALSKGLREKAKELAK